MELHHFKSSYSEKSIALWFSFLQIALLSLLAMLEHLLDQVDLQEVLGVEFFLVRETYLCIHER
jgi:hypothetical protein